MIKTNPPEEYKKLAGVAVLKYVDKIQSLYSAQELVDSWTQKYAAHFSDEELDRLISYYSSDLGKKDVTFNRNSLREVMAFLHEKEQPAIEKAIKEYTDDLTHAEVEIRKAAQTK